MQASVENISQIEKRMILSLPLGEIEQEVDNRLKRLAKTVKMHGFRPGKVPLKLVSQQYGPSVRSEVLGDVMQKSFFEAARENKLQVAGFPTFEPKPLGENAEAFEFSATFEVYPEVSVGDLGTLEINRPVYELTDADIDRTIDILRQQRTTYTPVDREAREKDQVTIDFAGSIDGVPFAGGEGEDFQVVVGAGQTLPEFEGGIVGMKAGETRNVDVAFPDDYHGKEVAGKQAVFQISVKEVAEPVLPEVNEEFVKQFGVEDGTPDSLRAEIRKNLERETRTRLQGRLKGEIMEKLVAAVDVELPNALVDSEVQRLMERTWSDYEQRGLSRKDVPLQKEYFVEDAKRRVKLGLILSQVVEANELKADADKVRAKIEDLAASYEQPEDVVRYYYSDENRLAEVENLVLEDTVVDFVASRAKVTDQPVSFDELMGVNA